MADFADGITSDRAWRGLAGAIQGKGAFRRFNVVGVEAQRSVAGVEDRRADGGIIAGQHHGRVRRLVDEVNDALHQRIECGAGKPSSWTSAARSSRAL